MRSCSGHTLRLGRAKSSQPLDLVRSSQAALLISGKGRSPAIDLSVDVLNMKTSYQRLAYHTMVLVFHLTASSFNSTDSLSDMVLSQSTVCR